MLWPYGWFWCMKWWGTHSMRFWAMIGETRINSIVTVSVIMWDKKSSPGERSPANPVDDTPHKAAKELDISKRVDMSAHDEKFIEYIFYQSNSTKT